MNAKSILNYYESILKEFGYSSEVNTKNENNCFLYSSLSQNERLELYITVIEQKLMIPKVESSPKYFDAISNENPPIDNELFIELKINSNLKSNEKNIALISIELQKINNTLLFPGFGLEFDSGLIFFRFTFLRPKGFMSKHTFLSILGMILLNMDAFYPILDTIIKENS